MDKSLTRRRGRRIVFPSTRKARIRARELRKNMTECELILWSCLKRGQMCGVDFHRQKPIDRFIVDFFAPDFLLAIEIDGSVHDSFKERDRERQKILEGMGLVFLRFSNDQVRYHLVNVLESIRHWIRSHNT